MTLEAFESLTTREQNVLLSLMRGSTAREIAEKDCVSLATVRSRIRSIISKLEVRSQLAAVVLAYQSGWPGLAKPDDLEPQATALGSRPSRG